MLALFCSGSTHKTLKPGPDFPDLPNFPKYFFMPCEYTRTDTQTCMRYICVKMKEGRSRRTHTATVRFETVKERAAEPSFFSANG